MDSSDNTHENLALAWKCILEQYRKKIEDASRKEAGMNIFVMRDNLKKGIFNCQYVYIERGGAVWKKYLAFSDNAAKIGALYDHEKMYLVSVHVPDRKDPTKTVGNIRGFLYNDHSEVNFQ